MCAQKLPAWQSVIGKGDHGIGKSQVVYQLAEHFNLQVTERRLSQMSEGDMIGLPVIKDKSTSFMPPDWYVDCCNNPRILFLDELNRATPEVMQAAFQIVLDRELMGHKLHPNTRVYAMVNTNAKYNVNQMDPALMDRFWAVELEPTLEDWLDWAKGRGGIHHAVTDFIAANPKFLDCGGKEVDETKVSPSRRSWEKLSKVLTANDLFDTMDNELFYGLSVGLIGAEASIQFQDFVKNMDKQISAEEILENYAKMRAKINKLGQERLNICIDKLADYAEKHKLQPKHAANIKAFAEDLPQELVMNLFSKLAKGGTQNLDNVKVAHAACKDLIINIYNTNPQALENAAKQAQEEEEKKRKEAEEAAAATATKGKAKKAK